MYWKECDERLEKENVQIFIWHDLPVAESTHWLSCGDTAHALCCCCGEKCQTDRPGNALTALSEGHTWNLTIRKMRKTKNPPFQSKSCANSNCLKTTIIP